MTVPYQSQLPPRFSACGWFRKVVFRWRGGVYKLVVGELFAWWCLWYAAKYVVIVNTAGVDSMPNAYWNKTIVFWRTYQASIRTVMSFMLVYYYQTIYARAKDIFFALPFPDSTFLTLNTHVGGNDARGRLLRATCFRYVLASTFVCYHGVSANMQRTYPDPYASLVRLGVLTGAEAASLRARHDAAYPYLGELVFLPVAWAQQAVRDAYDSGDVYPRDRASPSMWTYTGAVRDAMQALTGYRASCAAVLFQVYLPFPLLLSQLVTLCVYFYFFVALVAQQSISGEPYFYFPLFTTLEFIVYVGALRVGQTYSNPLGRDDDDFELVAFFNRNLRMAYLYGAYGNDGDRGAGEPPRRKQASTAAADAGNAPAFDTHAHPPPLVDLGHVQAQVLARTPLYFYDARRARRDAFGVAPPRSSCASDWCGAEDEKGYGPQAARLASPGSAGLAPRESVAHAPSPLRLGGSGGGGGGQAAQQHRAASFHLAEPTAGLRPNARRSYGAMGAVIEGHSLD